MTLKIDLKLVKPNQIACFCNCRWIRCSVVILQKNQKSDLDTNWKSNHLRTYMEKAWLPIVTEKIDQILNCGNFILNIALYITTDWIPDLRNLAKKKN